jgi:hypothetical protein
MRKIAINLETQKRNASRSLPVKSVCQAFVIVLWKSPKNKNNNKKTLFGIFPYCKGLKQLHIPEGFQRYLTYSERTVAWRPFNSLLANQIWINFLLYSGEGQNLADKPNL